MATQIRGTQSVTTRIALVLVAFLFLLGSVVTLQAADPREEEIDWGRNMIKEGSEMIMKGQKMKMEAEQMIVEGKMMMLKGEMKIKGISFE